MHADPGGVVDRGAPVAEVVDGARLWLEARVFEILSDSELANSQSKSPVRPDNRAVPPGINTPSTPVPEASSSPVKP